VTDYADLSVQRRDDGVVIVTLDNPAKRNAMSDAMTASWVQLMRELRDDPDARALLVTGAGRAFCSGGDTGWIGSEPDASVDHLRSRMLRFYRDWLSLRDLEIPTVAAVNGAAIGAGLCLALACDLRYAAPQAKLGAPFTSLGMHPGMAATWLLPEVAGMATARELLLTGRIVQGEEAREAGLVNRVLPEENFLESVTEIAGQIAAAAPVPTRYTTTALRQGGHATFEAAVQWEALAQPVTLATADLQEGLAAAREKRRPQFSGH